MTHHKWLNIIDMLETKFGIDKNYKETLGESIPGEKHIIEFTGPMGKMKLEWIEKARLKDVKTLYSARIGSDVKVSKVYDQQEKVSYMKAYQWDGTKNEWREIEGNKFEF